MRQAPDEAALLQAGDQPMNARLDLRPGRPSSRRRRARRHGGLRCCRMNSISRCCFCVSIGRCHRDISPFRPRGHRLGHIEQNVQATCSSLVLPQRQAVSWTRRYTFRGRSDPSACRRSPRPIPSELPRGGSRHLAWPPAISRGVAAAERRIGRGQRRHHRAVLAASRGGDLRVVGIGQPRAGSPRVRSFSGRARQQPVRCRHDIGRRGPLAVQRPATQGAWRRSAPRPGCRAGPALAFRPAGGTSAACRAASRSSRTRASSPWRRGPAARGHVRRPRRRRR